MTSPPLTFRQTPLQSWSGRIFRILLDTLSRPGTIGHLPPAPNLGEVPATAYLPLALASRGTAVSLVGYPSSVVAEVIAQTGARPAEVGDAELVAFGRAPRADELLHPRRGTPTIPEHGASVAVGSASVLSGTDQLSGATDHVRLRLTGPGVDGAAEIVINSAELDLPTLVRDRDTACSQPPTGLDLWFVDPAGHVCGIPRTTTITWQENS